MSLKTILKNFLNHVESLEVQRKVAKDLYEVDFHKLKELTEQLKHDKDYVCTQGLREVNRRKNRYKDILPYDYTRVVLSDYPGVPGSDYINANYIKGAGGSLAYIASQGPLPNTVVDFWRMIWECEVQVVVMACNEQESGKYKCECYWPGEGEKKQYGNINVELVKWRQVCPDFLVRTLKACWEEEERIICQFHYTTWPDHGVPTSVQPILELVRLVRDCQASEALPVLIHCSAGCGRTGTICAIDYVWGLMRMGKLTKSFNLFNIISDMRRQRIAMVQTKEQYVLVHRAVTSLFEQQLRVIDSHTYENLDEDGEPLILKELHQEEDIYEDILEPSAVEESIRIAELTDESQKYELSREQHDYQASNLKDVDTFQLSQKCEPEELSSQLIVEKCPDTGQKQTYCNFENTGLCHPLSDNVSDPSRLSGDLYAAKAGLQQNKDESDSDTDSGTSCSRNSQILLKLRREESVKRLISGWNRAVEKSDVTTNSGKSVQPEKKQNDYTSYRTLTAKEISGKQQVSVSEKHNKVLDSVKSKELYHEGEQLTKSQLIIDKPVYEANSMQEQRSPQKLDKEKNLNQKRFSNHIHSKGQAAEDIYHSGKLVGKATVIRRPSIAKLKALFEKSSPIDLDAPSDETSRHRRPLFRSHSHYVSHSRAFSVSDFSEQSTMETRTSIGRAEENQAAALGLFPLTTQSTEGGKEEFKWQSPSLHKEALKSNLITNVNRDAHQNIANYQGTESAYKVANAHHITNNEAIFSENFGEKSNGDGSINYKQKKYKDHDIIYKTNSWYGNSNQTSPEFETQPTTTSVKNYESSELNPMLDAKEMPSNIGNSTLVQNYNLQQATPVHLRIKQYSLSVTDNSKPPDLPLKKKTVLANVSSPVEFSCDEYINDQNRTPEKLHVTSNVTDQKNSPKGNEAHAISLTKSSNCSPSNDIRVVSKSNSLKNSERISAPQNINSSSPKYIHQDLNNAMFHGGYEDNSCAYNNSPFQKTELKTVNTGMNIADFHYSGSNTTPKNSYSEMSNTCINSSYNFSNQNAKFKLSVSCSTGGKPYSPVNRMINDTKVSTPKETRYMNVNSLAQRNIQQIEDKLKNHPRGAIIDLTSRKSYIDEMQANYDAPTSKETDHHMKHQMLLETHDQKSLENSTTSSGNKKESPKDSVVSNIATASQQNNKNSFRYSESNASSQPKIISEHGVNVINSTVLENSEVAKIQSHSKNLLLHSPPPKSKRTHLLKTGQKLHITSNNSELATNETLAEGAAGNTSNILHSSSHNKTNLGNASLTNSPCDQSSDLSSNMLTHGNPPCAPNRSDPRYFPVTRQTVWDSKYTSKNSKGLVSKTEDHKSGQELNFHKNPVNESKVDSHKILIQNNPKLISEIQEKISQQNKILTKSQPTYDYKGIHQLDYRSQGENESAYCLQRSTSGPNILPTMPDNPQKVVPNNEINNPVSQMRYPQNHSIVNQLQSHSHDSYNMPFHEQHNVSAMQSPFPPGPPKPPRTFHYDFRNNQDRAMISESHKLQHSTGRDGGRLLVSVASPKHSSDRNRQQIVGVQNMDYGYYVNDHTKHIDASCSINCPAPFQRQPSLSSPQNELFMSRSYPSTTYNTFFLPSKSTDRQFYSEAIVHENMHPATNMGEHNASSSYHSANEKARQSKECLYGTVKPRNTFSDYENIYDAQRDYLQVVTNTDGEDKNINIHQGLNQTPIHGLQYSQSDASVYAALRSPKPPDQSSPSAIQLPMYITEKNILTLPKTTIFDTLQRRSKQQVTWEQRRSHDDMDIRPAPSSRLKEQIHARRSMVELDNLEITVASDKGFQEKTLSHSTSAKHDCNQDNITVSGERLHALEQKGKSVNNIIESTHSKDLQNKKGHTHTRETGSFGGTLSKAFGKLTSLTKFNAKDPTSNQYSAEGSVNPSKGAISKSKERDKSSFNFPHRIPKKSKDPREPPEQWTQV